MLRELSIENLVLIDRLRLLPGEGMNVFTGETGSGKSMIIDALALLAGERGRSELIRTGSPRLLVEGVFDWPGQPDFNQLAAGWGLDPEDGCLIINREITLNGRNATRINGHNYPLSTLRSLAPWLLNIHAQEDTQELLAANHYLSYLDQSQPQLTDLSAQLTKQYTICRSLDQQLETYTAERQVWLRERDFLEYQCQEIEAASLQPGEEDELEVRCRLMRNAGQMMEISHQTDEILFNAKEGAAAEELIDHARRLVVRHANEPALAALVKTLDEIALQMDEAKSQLHQLDSVLDFVPEDLEAVEERLHQLARLFKKYGSGSREVLHTQQQLSERLEQMNRWEEKEQELLTAKSQAWDDYHRLAEQVSTWRQKMALQIAGSVQEELANLAMPRALFDMRFERLPEPGPQGLDKVWFLFSDNPGQELRPLHRIASGGELSRLALALKVVLVAQLEAQVFVFDEIDAGMSGYAIEQIAARIAALSNERQVLLVTHAPVVAAYADHHFVISKESSADTTYTSVLELAPEQIVEQLVHMMGEGHAPASALKYAQELRQAALTARKLIS
ncbi:MAG: DNA repair protein RecN [Methanomassiliicoccales archaeon]